MDSATRQTLANVDRKIERLQDLRQRIIEEFGEPSSNGTADLPKNVHKRKKRKATQTNGILRKDQIHQWLKKNGPAFRSEIIKGTSLPDGTVGAYLSTEKDLFENRDGRWAAR